MRLASHIRRGIHTRAKPEQVYALLADVPKSVAHFPDLDSITFDKGAWVWRMTKLGAGPLSFQVVYAAVYSFDPTAMSVRWLGVPNFGNTQVRGAWEIHSGAETEFVLDNHFALEAPFPSLLRSAAEALMTRENDRLIATYLQNLKHTLDGLAG